MIIKNCFLKVFLRRKLEGHEYDDNELEANKIKEAFNNAAISVDFFNTLESENDGYSWIDIDIERFE